MIAFKLNKRILTCLSTFLLLTTVSAAVKELNVTHSNPASPANTSDLVRFNELSSNNTNITGPNFLSLKTNDKWVFVNVLGNLPPLSVYAGRDNDGTALYVCRAHSSFGLLPGKYNPVYKKAYISYAGAEYIVQPIEVLTGNGYYWVAGDNGWVPSNAVIGGQTSYGEILYVGRGYYSNSLTPGKIHSSQRGLYISFNGSEHKLLRYEVLVHN